MPRYDPLMLLESGRQAFVRAVHEVMEVPRTSQFLFVDVEMQVGDPEALRAGPRPAELVWAGGWRTPATCAGSRPAPAPAVSCTSTGCRA